jgi:hypothetical protein
VGLALHHVDSLVAVLKGAVILRYHILAISTARAVRNVHFWWNDDACVGSAWSRISNAGWWISVAARFAERNFDVGIISAESPAIARASARMPTVRHVSSLAERRRRLVATRTRRLVTLLTLARRKSLAQARCSSPVSVRLKSKK